jgi:hypothetical protein
MRLATVAVVVGLLLLAVVGAGAIGARQRATNAVGAQAEPLLVGAEGIYTSLADADATATNTFLKSGLEPPDRRQHYLDDLSSAATKLASVAHQAGSSPQVTAALRVITTDVPTYSGLVEAARANNRLGFPVGAAYLREGSTLMQTEILPAVRQLFQIEATRLNQSYHSGQSGLDEAGLVAVAGVALAALLLSQLFLARRTNRVLNLPLLVATFLVLVLLGWTLVALGTSSARLQQARTKGSDPLQLLSSAQILLSRAQSDENLALVARGSGSQYLADFAAVTTELGAPPTGSGGLIDHATIAAAPPGIPPELYTAYLAAHNAVVNAVNSGQFAQAVEVATGAAATDELPAASQLGQAISRSIDASQKVFAAKAAAARDDLSLLALALLAAVVLAGAAAIAGLEQRINEYR